MTYRNLGAVIRQLREQKGISQEELANPIMHMPRKSLV
jgi:ribosome-binding protein aMBF1 (putative translation factor)